jgi:hypothetical protein
MKPLCNKKLYTLLPFLPGICNRSIRRQCFDVTLIDAPAAGLDRQATIEMVKKLKPDLVVCETSTPSIENDMEVMLIFKMLFK